jgi:hypothetical protein
MIHNMLDNLHLNVGRPENRDSIPSSVQISCGGNQAVNWRLFPVV